jgi:hypothetical protein
MAERLLELRCWSLAIGHRSLVDTPSLAAVQ